MGQDGHAPARFGNKLIVESSAALATAATLDTPRRQRVRPVCLVTGGSISADQFAAILTAENQRIDRSALTSSKPWGYAPTCSSAPPT